MTSRDSKADEKPAAAPPQLAGPETPVTKYLARIRAASAKHKVPWRWIAATMGQESNYGRHPSVVLGLSNPASPASVSEDGLSYGPWQVVPLTADWMTGRKNGTTKWWELNDFDFNLEVACKYFAFLQKTFPGHREFIVRGYNGGPGFQSTKMGQSQTPIYYRQWIGRLAEIQKWYPGNEMEIG